MKENLIGYNVISPLKLEQVTRNIKQKALDYLMYFKKKVVVKSRGEGAWMDASKENTFQKKNHPHQLHLHKHLLQPVLLMQYRIAVWLQ